MRLDPPDKATNYNHVHLYDKEGNSLDSNLKRVDYKSPDAHIRYKGPDDPNDPNSSSGSGAGGNDSGGDGSGADGSDQGTGPNLIMPPDVPVLPRITVPDIFVPDIVFPEFFPIL
jgi:hypothetical protein